MFLVFVGRSDRKDLGPNPQWGFPVAVDTAATVKTAAPTELMR